MFHADRRTDMKLIVAFSNFEKATESCFFASIAHFTNKHFRVALVVTARSVRLTHSLTQSLTQGLVWTNSVLTNATRCIQTAMKLIFLKSNVETRTVFLSPAITCGGVELQFRSSLTLATGRPEWSSSRPGRISLRKGLVKPTEQEASWAQSPVLTIQKTLLPLLENEPQFFGRPVHPLLLPTTLPQLRCMVRLMQFYNFISGVFSKMKVLHRQKYVVVGTLTICIQVVSQSDYVSSVTRLEYLD